MKFKKLFEARSDAYRFTHHKGDPDTELQLRQLRDSIKAGNKDVAKGDWKSTVVVKPRLGRNNPAAEKYKPQHEYPPLETSKISDEQSQPPAHPIAGGRPWPLKGSILNTARKLKADENWGVHSVPRSGNGYGVGPDTPPDTLTINQHGTHQYDYYHKSYEMADYGKIVKKTAKFTDRHLSRPAKYVGRDQPSRKAIDHDDAERFDVYVHRRLKE